MIEVRVLLNQDQYKIVTGSDVIFEDGNVHTYTKHQLKALWILLQCFKKSGRLLISSRYQYLNRDNNKSFSHMENIKFYSIFYEDAIEHYGNNWETKTSLTYLIAYNNNLFYNFSVSKRNHTSFLTLRNLLEIHNDPRIIEVKSRRVHNHPWVSEVDRVVDEVLRDKKYENNPIAQGYINGILKPAQVRKVYGVVGFVSGIDGEIFPEPVDKGYLEGLGGIGAMAMESNLAQKALVYQDTVIADSETLARLMQLVNIIVEKIDISHDCGSRDYLHFYVNGEVAEDGRIKDSGDLKFIFNMYYLDDDENTLKVVTKESAELIGKTIKLRWPSGCQHSDPHTVCGVCFGEQSKYFDERLNIGHSASAGSNEKISQRNLAIKHVQTSAEGKSAKLNKNTMKYFETHELTINLKSSLCSYDEIYLEIPTNAIPNMMAIIHNKHVKPIMFNTYIKTVRLIMKKDGVVTTNRCTIGKLNNEAHFTNDFIEWLRGQRLGSKQGSYSFDLSKFNLHTPIFEFREKEHSFQEELATIKAHLLFGGEKVLQDKSPEAAIMAVYHLFKSSINFHISSLGVIIYAITAADPDNKDHPNMWLARGYQYQATRKIVSLVRASSGRSASASMAHLPMGRCLRNPELMENAMDHPFDVLFMPQEVINNN